MFAPEEVFSKKSLPKGYYYPSPYNQQNGAEAFVESNNDTNISIDMKNTSQPEGENLLTKNDDSSESVDDLIREIDKNLSLDPDFQPPEAAVKTDIGNILSVSGCSNNVSQHSVISPDALNFYLNRFKNHDPTHPTKRPCHNDQTTSHPDSKRNVETESNEVDVTSKSSISYDSTTFLNNVLSSDDSSPWEFQENVSISPNHSYLPKGMNNITPPKNKPSFIEELTGKSFTELSKLVPDEVLNPRSENDDILYQWRLKKKITEAKKTEDMSVLSNLPTTEEVEAIPLPLKDSRGPAEIPEKRTINVSREIQTEAEKVQIGCQVDFAPSPKKSNSCHVDVVSSPKRLNTHQVDVGCSPKKLDSEDPPKCINKGILNLIYNQDSCSDFSISSVSTDDLTNISFLDDEEDERPLEGEQQNNSADPLDKTLEVSNKSQDKGNDTLEDVMDVVDSRSHDKLRANSGTEQQFPVECKFEDEEKTEELIAYLDNIKDSLDDELLDVFIDKYKSVLSQIKAIENEINVRCNEL